MSIVSQKLQVITISTTLPRRCGIATFNDDVTRELVTAGVDVKNVALERKRQRHAYPSTTISTISQERASDYARAAYFINTIRPDVVLLEHEFGIYGGRWGSHILELITRLNVPVISVIHTYPFQRTTEDQRYQASLLRDIAKASTRVITISGLTQRRLARELAAAAIHTPVVHIPHGTPNVLNYYLPYPKRTVVGKAKALVIATFGLIGERKGLDDVIAVLPQLIPQHPNLVYRVLGAPHPTDAQAHEYLRRLRQQVKELGISQHVQFVTRFLSVKEIMENLQATDIYVTAYNDPNQASSGTLSYAVAAGCCVISTPYIHARELLSQDRGILVPFHDRAALGQALGVLLADPDKRKGYQRRALAYGATTAWEHVGQQYLHVLDSAATSRHQSPMQAATATPQKITRHNQAGSHPIEWQNSRSREMP